MTQKQFQAACAALWGPRYQLEATRELGVGRSSVVRYDAGERAVPDAIAERLRQLLTERGRLINGLLVRW